METVTVSSKGQIAIPKEVRDQLGITEGTRLDIQVDGAKLILSKSQDWRDLYGMLAGTDLLNNYERAKAEERERENASR